MMLLTTERPCKTGVPAKSIVKLLEEYENQEILFHGIMILKDGKVIAKGQKSPYKAEDTHVMFSLSKSFTSAAIGFASDEGLLDVEDYVISFFPEMLTARPCENMAKMKIKHLLTMSTGHDVEPQMRISENWEETFLRSYVALEPGSSFLYNTPATYMLSAILQKVSGVTTFEFLQKRLFEPLGIKNIRWEKSPNGVSTGGWGLNLKTEDIAKFGLFLQNRGVVEGKQLLSREWIETASSKLVENAGGKCWGSGYGYQFWQCSQEGCYRGDGAFGQYCFVDNKDNLVIAMTGGMGDMQKPLDLIYEILLPTIKQGEIAETEEELAYEQKLTKLLANLNTPALTGEKAPPSGTEIDGHYEIPQNMLGITALEFSFKNKDIPIMKIISNERSCDIKLGFGEYLESDTYVSVDEIQTWHHPDLYEKMASSYSFEGNKLKLKLIYNTTPFCDNVEVLFDKGTFKLSWNRDRGFGEIGFETFGILR